MASIKAKVTNAIDKLTHKSTSSTNSSLADTDGVHTSHTPSPTHSYQSSTAQTGGVGTTAGGVGTTAGGVGSTAGGLGGSSATTYDRDVNTTSGTTTGAGVGGIEGYHHATPTGIDSAGYNKVTDTTPHITPPAGHRDGVIQESEIIDSKVFTKTVDHEVLVEKKTYVLEHRPVQETYVVETRKVGEGRVPGRATEIVGTEVNEVDHKTVAAPRGERTVVVQDVDVPLEDLNISGRTVDSTHDSTVGRQV